MSDECRALNISDASFCFACFRNWFANRDFAFTSCIELGLRICKLGTLSSYSETSIHLLQQHRFLCFHFRFRALTRKALPVVYTCTKQFASFTGHLSPPLILLGLLLVHIKSSLLLRSGSCRHFQASGNLILTRRSFQSYQRIYQVSYELDTTTTIAQLLRFVGLSRKPNENPTHSRVIVSRTTGLISRSMDMDWDDESGLHDPPPMESQERSDLTTYNPPTMETGLKGGPGPDEASEMELGERNESGLYDPSEVETGERNPSGPYDPSEAEIVEQSESGAYDPSEVEEGERNKSGPFDPAEVEIGERNESGPYNPSDVEIRERDEPEPYATPEVESGERNTFGTYDPSEVEIGPENGLGSHDPAPTKTGEGDKLGSRDLFANQESGKSGSKEYDPALIRGGEDVEQTPRDPSATGTGQESAPVLQEFSETEIAARKVEEKEAGADEQPGAETKEGSDSENSYQVQKLVGKRVRRRGKRNVLEYLVRWSGYAPKFDQWMPITDLSNTLELIQDYEAANQADDAAPRGEKRKAEVASSPRKQPSFKKQRLEARGNSVAAATLRKRGRPTKQRPALRSVRSVHFDKRGRSGKQLPETRSAISQKGEADTPRTRGTPREAFIQNGPTNTPTKRGDLRKTTNENGVTDALVKRGRAEKQLSEHNQVENGTTGTETPDNPRQKGRPKGVTKEGEEPDSPRTRGTKPKSLWKTGTRGGPKKQLAAIHPPINRKRPGNTKVAPRQLRSRK